MNAASPAAITVRLITTFTSNSRYFPIPMAYAARNAAVPTIDTGTVQTANEVSPRALPSTTAGTKTAAPQTIHLNWSRLVPLDLR